MAASGFAGLGYQIVWTQQCALWLGHEAAAMLAVVAAFFGGIAVGASLLGARIERSARPERWYAALELTIAVWSLVLAVLLGPVSDTMLALTGPQPTAAWQWGVAFAGTFLLLLPATAAMGATLPAMNRLLSTVTRDKQAIAALYASNTLGAVLGVLACALWLIPAFGLVRSAAVCALCNVACAGAALLLRPDSRANPLIPSPTAQGSANRTLGLLACTGLLGIGYEVLVVRVLSQVTEDTVYTFALLLAVYLLGTAAGAAAYQRWLTGREPARERVRDRLLCLQSIACLIGTATLWGAEAVRQAAVGPAGDSMVAALIAEAALGLAAFGLPTLVMGALFSHLAIEANARGANLGRVLGVNTAGAMLAPLLVGVLLAPAIGPKGCLLLIAAGYLALALAGTRSMPIAWASGVVLIVLALAAPPLAFVDVPDGGHVVSYQDGTMAAVSVVEDGQGVSRLRINNRQQEGSSATRLADARQAFLPLLLHPAPRHALFLGLGTGVTARAATEDGTLQVDAVELLPEVVAASTHFAEPSAANPSLHVMTADARRYVKTTQRAYDVIVADNFHPARNGSGALYTVEHFDAVRRRLTEQGVFCQWLPLHQLDLATLRSIVGSFAAVYPHGAALLATNSLETPVLGLVARNDARPFDRPALQARLASLAPARPLADYGLADDFALFGSFVAGPQALKRFAGDAPINTDDRPIVAYRAPRITYAPDSMPRDRLVALLDELASQPIELAELIDTQGDAAWSQRLAAYRTARHRFLEAGRNVRATGDIRRMLAQVRDPLLDVLRISPDFRPAYDPLLRMAVESARSDPAQSRALLAELERIQPARPEASQWSDRLRDAQR